MKILLAAKAAFGWRRGVWRDECEGGEAYAYTLELSCTYTYTHMHACWTYSSHEDAKEGQARRHAGDDGT